MLNYISRVTLHESKKKTQSPTCHSVIGQKSLYNREPKITLKFVAKAKNLPDRSKRIWHVSSKVTQNRLVTLSDEANLGYYFAVRDMCSNTIEYE